MLVLLGFLLVALIKPYYRENRIKMIDTLVSTIENELLVNKPSEASILKTDRLVNNNNVCAIIYNQNGRRVYSADSLGELCVFDEPININGDDLVVYDDGTKLVDKLNEYNVISETLTSPTTDLEMLLYGKKVSINLANYYLLVNAPLELLDSYVDFILKQYLLLSMFIVILALIVSFLLANKITSPIVNMQKQASKLADGDYHVSFKSDKEPYSEINALASTLDDATEKLSKIDELRKDLLANVSHDLRTPITLIRSYAEMIKDISGDDPIKRDQHLDVIIDETEYLTKLINDMQEYSKLQAGFINLNKFNFDIEKSITNVCKLLSGLMKEKNITLKKDLKSVIVYGDETKISEVIYNYLSNAIKHSDENSTIYVSIRDSVDSLYFEVKDEGDGISEKELPYIWDRYYKIDKNFRRNENSTGLGLAIAKAILEAHGAKYGVVSKVGEGSTFYFELSKDYDDETE